MRPRFSLVLATVGRAQELERFLESLERQGVDQVETIVVDQAASGELERVLARFDETLTIVRRSSRRGACRARNVGLQVARGEIVSFPDDDCWYPDGLLARVAAALNDHPDWDGLVGRPADEDGRSAHARWDAEPGVVTRFNAWNRGITPTTFLRRPVTDAVGGFDEAIGPGAETGLSGSDDTDYLLRAVERGFVVHYDPDLVVYHPDPPIEGDPRAPLRGYAYGRSMTAVLRKHRYPSWYVAYACARPLGGAALSLARGRRERARFHWAIFRGRAREAVRRRSKTAA